ncbi:MAG: RDD family protein, partial [Alteraurantiacibacter sp.]
MSAAVLSREEGKRDRMLVTPEGLALPLTVGSRGARAGALLLDLTFLWIGAIVFFMILLALGFGLLGLGGGGENNAALELVAVILI